MPFSPLPEILKDLRRGRGVVIVDDAARENEGDVCYAAEKITPRKVNFMATHARGLICLALTEERCEELRLPQMVPDNTSLHATAFTVSIEARGSTTTGISAHDRAATIRTAIHPATRPEDLLRPGHVFPLRARPGGVLRRAGHTEAIVDLCRLAGLSPAGALCEVIREDGTMARLPDLKRFAARHELKMISVEEIIRHRLRNERIITREANPSLPTRFGDFRISAYRVEATSEEHVALVLGEIRETDPVLVRVHSQCLTGDVFGSLRCDCGEQLRRSLELIADERRGVLLYLLQEGRGIGLLNKLKAYEVQDRHGADTVEANERLGLPADMRDYGVGAQILRDLGVRRMRLLTNNPLKYIGLAGYGLEIVERVPIMVAPNPRNAVYLATKQTKMGHLLDGAPAADAGGPTPGA